MTKELLNQVAEQLPEQFQLDDLIDRLIMAEAIEKGRQQCRDGRVRTHAEVKKRLKKVMSAEDEELAFREATLRNNRRFRIANAQTE